VAVRPSLANVVRVDQTGTTTERDGIVKNVEMTDMEGVPATGTPEHDDELLLDRIDALQVLRAETPEEKGAILERVAGSGRVEQDIVRQLGKVRPLWRPQRFEEAHRMAMRSIEVLDRNGARAAKLPRLGPIAPVAGFVVGRLVQWIVRGYQNSIVTQIRELYERREANSVWGSDEHRMLRRARINAVQVEQGFKANPIGVPAFLLGGAILSTLMGAVQSFFNWAIKGTGGLVVLGLSLLVVLGGLSWAALYAAGVARRRIRLSTEQPLRALWETIGAAGDPPRDQSYSFAVYALVLLTLAAVVVPAVFALIVLR
jgi:hypothetical protein